MKERKEKAIHQTEEMEAEVKKNPNINLRKSVLDKFDKQHEFVVLKKRIFSIQSVSPKKIILKYKRRLRENDTLPEGLYLFRDKDDKLLDPMKTFIKFDKMAADSYKEKEDDNG